jgi:hypothetical protein
MNPEKYLQEFKKKEEMERKEIMKAVRERQEASKEKKPQKK